MTAQDERRRQPRLPSTCRAQIRDRFTAWTCETVDIGPRGCLLITPRSLTVGALVKLSIASERVESALEVAGQVVWTERRLPFRAGISFTGATSEMSPARWFDALVAAEIDEVLRSGDGVAALAGVHVYLGAPPALGPLRASEAELVRSVGDGAALKEVLDRDADTVRSLLARGRLTLARAAAVAPARWVDALSRRVEAPDERPPTARVGESPSEFELVVAEPVELSPNLVRLLEGAVDALLYGDVSAAERFLRRAQAVAPGEVTSQLMLRRIAAQQGARRRCVGVENAPLGGDAEAS